MARVRVIAVSSSVFVVTAAALTYSALPERTDPALASLSGTEASVSPSGAPGREPAGDKPLSTGLAPTASGSGRPEGLFSRVLAMVVGKPADETRDVAGAPVQAAVKLPGTGSRTRTGSGSGAGADTGRDTDPDADWYAVVEEPAEGEEEHVLPRGKPQSPSREVGQADWYDGLGGAKLGRSAAPEDFRVVRLANAAPGVPGAAGSAPAGMAGLPAPSKATGSAVPGVAVASLGPKLEGKGATAYPGLAAPLPVATPKTSFCPIGSKEKSSKTERWCTRTDKGGVSFKDGPVVLIYANGKKRAEGTYDDGVFHGVFVEYSPQGRKIAEGAYKKGRRNGRWTFWWDDGKKQSEGPFASGERSGVWTYYDEQGRKQSQGEIRTIGNVEKKQGRWTFFHANGAKAQEGQFDAGVKTGAWKTFDTRGRLVATLASEEGF